MEIEDIIKEIIDEEDQELKQEQTHKEYIESKKTKKARLFKISQITLVISIALFLLMLILPWYKLGGRATNEGLVRIPNNIIAKEYKELSINDKINYNGVYVKMSPVNLITYGAKYFNNYKTIIDNEGENRISVFSYMHMMYIFLFIATILLSLLSIAILLLQKGLKLIKIIKWSAIINFVVFLLNFLALKIPFFNMFALYALKELRRINTNGLIDMTQKGIAVNNEFYHYTLSLGIPFFIALTLLVIWFGMTVLLKKCNDTESE